MALKLGATDTVGNLFNHARRHSDGFVEIKQNVNYYSPETYYYETIERNIYVNPIHTVMVATDETGDYDNIQNAINDLPTTGGVIYVKEGIYDLNGGTITINKDNVHIISLDKGAIIKNSGATSIYATGVDKFYIKGLTFEGGTYGIYIADNCTQWEISNNKFDSQTTASIYLTVTNTSGTMPIENGKIAENYITSSWGLNARGIVLYCNNAGSNYIYYISIINNQLRSIWNDGIMLYCSAGAIANEGYISGCSITGNILAGIGNAAGEDGISLADSHVMYSTVVANVVANCFYGTAYVNGSASNQMAHNTTI